MPSAEPVGPATEAGDRAGAGRGRGSWRSARWPWSSWPGRWPRARCRGWRQQQAVDAAAAAAAAAPPRVTVAVAQPMAADAERVLPGNALPLLEAAIFARTTGYLKTTAGGHRRPRQGRAVAGRDHRPGHRRPAGPGQGQPGPGPGQPPLAEANAELAKTTLAPRHQDRTGHRRHLSGTDRPGPAHGRTTTASVEAAQASIQVNEAAVQRYTDLQGFQKITAPFPGVITARNVDPGDLITADSPSTTREMFHLMRTDILRVFVNVPQVFATGIKVGQSAVVYQRDDPAEAVPGQGDAHGRRAGPEHADAAHRGGRAQPGQRPAAGDVPAGQVRLRPRTPCRS